MEPSKALMTLWIEESLLRECFSCWITPCELCDALWLFSIVLDHYAICFYWRRQTFIVLHQSFISINNTKLHSNPHCINWKQLERISSKTFHSGPFYKWTSPRGEFYLSSKNEYYSSWLNYANRKRNLLPASPILITNFKVEW